MRPVSGPSGVLLRGLLELGDAIVGNLPESVAYGLADLLGEVWYRSAPDRRRLVAANLARVAEATGRPLRGAALRRQVRAAFVAHARYYLEVVLLPRARGRDIGDFLEWHDEAGLEALLRESGVIAVSPHFGNFEPAALWMASRGLRWVAPVEQVEPPALFDYLRSRRGAKSAGGELVTSPDAARRVRAALRNHELVAIAADRDVGSPTLTVDFFGHPAQLPSAPATLALLTGSPVVIGSIRRLSPGRFVGRIEPVEWTPTGDRRADLATLTQRSTDMLAERIAEAPEQWWGAFQVVWGDLTPETVNR
jgi:phosphatidylinositol dimannoside acyltransferase